MTIFERDFDALAVGERFVSEGRRIEESDILAFATLFGFFVLRRSTGR